MKTTQHRLHLVAIATYALFAFIILHPQWFYNGRRVAGYDYFNYHWNFWWIRFASTRPDLNIYLNDYVMFPFTNSFGFHALAAFWYPVWALIEPLSDTFTAMTVIITLGCVLNGYVLFALLRREGVSAGLALVGGLALQASPVSRYFYYNTHINLMDWFWLPAHLMLWAQTVRAVEKKQLTWAVFWAVVQGIGLWGAALTDLQMPIFIAFVVVPYGLFTLWRSSQRLRLIAVGLLTVGVTLALLWFAGPLSYMLAFEGDLIPGTVEDRPGIPFPRGYFSVDPVWWHWNTPTMGGFVTILFLSALVFSIRRRQHNRNRWLWFWVALPPLVLSMGPSLHFGSIEIPMPYRLMHAVTDGMFRMPWRLAPVFLVAAVLFALLTWNPALNRKRALWLVPLMIWLLAFDVRLFEAGPTQEPLTHYTFYETMGQETGAPYDDYVVIEVPTGAGTGEILIDELATQLQWYGMWHQKRTVNGFISRAPLERFWYLRTDDPMLSWLGQRRFLEPERVEEQLRERIFDWPIGYVVVHQDHIGKPGAIPQEMLGYLNGLPDLLCPVWVEGDAVAYRTTWHPDGCPERTPPEVEPDVYRIDIGATGDERFIGWGWYWAEPVFDLTLRWAGAAVLDKPETETHLYVDLPPDDYEITIAAQAFFEPRALSLEVNGIRLDETVTVATDAMQPYTFTLPADVVADGENLTLSLVYDATVKPSDVDQGEDGRSLGIAVDWIEFRT